MLRQIHSHVLNRYVGEVWNLGRVESIDELIHPKYVHRLSNRSAQLAGRERLKRDVCAWRTAFPDLHKEIIDELHDGERVAIRIVAHGTHERSLFGNPPTGRRFEIDQMHVVRFSDGRIIEHWPGCAFVPAVFGQMKASLVPAPALETDLRVQLRESLRAAFLEDTSTMPDVRKLARRLATSSRTLQRHLQRAGSSFREEVDAVRRELASRYLTETDFALDEIANRLRFGGFTSFVRAFRRWYHTTPRRFRLEYRVGG